MWCWSETRATSAKGTFAINGRREVTREEAERLALRYGFDFMETSAKTGDNVEELFRFVSEKVIRLIESGQFDPDTETVPIPLT